jgi:hypothetical protein
MRQYLASFEQIAQSREIPARGCGPDHQRANAVPFRLQWALANRAQIATSRNVYDERDEKLKQPTRSGRPAA